MKFEKSFKPYVAKFVEPSGYSFNLNEDMLAIVAKEFSPEKLAAQFAEAAKGKSGEEAGEAAKNMLVEFGRKLIRRSYELGDQYPDRTYEMIKETSDRTGEFIFPFIGQRAIEIAYLSTQGLYSIPVDENNQYRLEYNIEECKYFNAIKEKCGVETANLLACRHLCFAAAETVFSDLGKKVVAELLAETPKDGFCRFSVTKVR